MIWSGIGINYGHQITLGYNTAQVDSDLNFLKAAGVSKLRVAFPIYTDSATIINCQDICVRALAKGFYVSWGVVPWPNPITATIWSNFKTYVTGTLGPWAQSVGLSELSMGNEEEEVVDGTTLTAATLRSDTKTVAGTIKTNGFTGLTSYQSQTGNIAAWNAIGLGSLDRIGFNCYNVLSVFSTNVTTLVSNFGANTYVSEFGAITTGYPDFNNEIDWFNDVSARITILQNSGVGSGYFFTYRDGGFGITADTWALVLANESIRTARYAVLGQRRPATTRTTNNRSVISSRSKVARTII